MVSKIRGIIDSKSGAKAFAPDIIILYILIKSDSISFLPIGQYNKLIVADSFSICYNLLNQIWRRGDKTCGLSGQKDIS